MTRDWLPSALDPVLPMHLRLDACGRILHAGPTLRKLRDPGALLGAAFEEVFVLRRPRTIDGFSDLAAAGPTSLVLDFADPPQTEFSGLAVPGPDGGLLINLGFRISILDALEHYDLHSRDFAPTDLTVEMLYLMEAKSALMDESRRLNTRLQAARIAAEEQAFTDTLTGLKNRRALAHVAARLAAARRPFALVHLDLDRFKSVNDGLGHAAGDHVLQHVAGLMVRHTRSGDTLVRSGGDEFLLLLPDLTDPTQLRGLAERLIRAIERPVPFDGHLCEISASAGISIETGAYRIDLDTHVARSDHALYAAKNAGRGRAMLHDLSEQPAAQAGAAPSGVPQFQRPVPPR